MTALEFKMFLENTSILKYIHYMIPSLNYNLDINEIRIFNLFEIYFAFISFSKKEDCDKIYNFFNDANKLEKYLTLNSNGCQIGISYCYDLTDLKNSEWYAVVLRNLDPKYTKEQIENFCKNLNHGVEYALHPCKIFNSYCSIVVMNDLDNAEKLTIILNSKEIREASNNDIKIKVKLLIFIFTGTFTSKMQQIQEKP
jgi:hypothetical protein